MINLCFGYYQSEGNRTTGFTVLNDVNLSVAEEQKVELSITAVQLFRTTIAEMLMQGTSIKHNAVVIQTIGASGGLWLNFKLLFKPNRQQTIWFSEPGWGNQVVKALNRMTLLGMPDSVRIA